MRFPGTQGEAEGQEGWVEKAKQIVFWRQLSLSSTLDGILNLIYTPLFLNKPRSPQMVHDIKLTALISWGSSGFSEQYEC